MPVAGGADAAKDWYRKSSAPEPFDACHCSVLNEPTQVRFAVPPPPRHQTCRATRLVSQLLHPGLFLNVARCSVMRGEPHAALGFHVLNQHLERHDARTVPGDVRMVRQDEHGMFLPRLVELIHPYKRDLAR